MKITVDAPRCQSTGMCIAVAPEILELLPNGVAHPTVDELSDDLVELAQDAVLSCPTAAIAVTQD